MEAKPCPRCGETFQPVSGRGRPRVWCSTECRRLAFEERRAARTAGRAVEIREEIRERVVERSRPLTPDGAVDRVLSDPVATHKLLRVLAHRMRADPPTSQVDRWQHQAFKPLIYDLWQAYHEAGEGRAAAMPEVLPAPYTPPRNRADAHREAVALVLNSPRSTREVLSTLADRARDGILASSAHRATVTAATDLLNALITTGTLRRR
ncbi:hypothetical protein [Nocardia gipuzkoensis]|uniref:hypothetical protein n=1 Tax=Nocardia gipuzkoensis TaxID=2749991 RepID=UPI00237E820F|nr:hypothetical protein [Nocardia gipuzkoensis]MDE1674691.1 hypothetical protein [Nocardia gipuzkoensis]